MTGDKKAEKKREKKKEEEERRRTHTRDEAPLTLKRKRKKTNEPNQIASPATHVTMATEEDANYPKEFGELVPWGDPGT